MRICYFGIYSTAPEYPRNNNIIQGLRRLGVTVDECRVELEESFASRARVAQSFLQMALFLAKLILSYLRLLFRLTRLPGPDLFVVGHPGYFHLHFLKVIRGLFYRGIPIVYDIFIPLYDAVVCDRKFFQENSLPARVLHWFEGSVCRHADLCLIDTDEHCEYMARQFQVPRTRIEKLFVGSVFLDSNNRASSKAVPDENKSIFKVLHFATYIPLHGMDTTIRSARILEGYPDIRFLVVGRGQLEGEIKALAKKLNLENLEFQDWVSVEELRRLVARAHVCLGIFGVTEKTKRVIPSKAFDTLAVGRPLISADTQAMREVFTHRENIYFVPLNDPEALAQAIQTLKVDPELRDRIARAGHELYQEMFTPEAIGRQFLRVVEKHFKENFKSSG
jgi:glycosyltransferase involved in cell wall biosynthesis